MITEEIRVETVEKVKRALVTFERELALVDCLDGHRVVQNDNLGYYRSQVHCSCAAEWWAGEHSGDPSYEEMWAIHRAEVIAAFLADRPASTTGSDQ